ncbi:OLC1v1004099C1 [Oldenlandia corymbosa var. corymbosa]|uniref:OLC1v1004099C1 n=1 Tax=Oldenlandia corymbosa var. corymbosa TaxID=529605 RepID=A0AAV1DCR5_OLDCO|nr:OLC1v1004099C1 [Oldenlandia corymbosa var. corymbosa]
MHAVTMASLTLAASGWMSNLVVYLIEKFNMSNVDAAQVMNVVNGSTNLIPVVGAILADSFLGCYTVIWISSSISLLGITLLILTVTIDSMRPQPCNILAPNPICSSPSKLQYVALYTAFTLATTGAGGTRFTNGTMGADQFSNPKDQTTYFNWYFFTLYTASVIGATAVVYVEDSVSWAVGFGICVAANAIGLLVFLLGSTFYRYVKPKSSPFTALARVLVASIRKRHIRPSPDSEDYYNGPNGNSKTRTTLGTPTESFRFLNRAAWKTEGDLNPNGSIAKMWKICTVEEVEDLKSLIRIFPLWSSSIFLGTPIGIQASLTILQTLVVDRHLGPHFQFPVGSILVISLISTSIFIFLYDTILLTSWKKIFGKIPTPFQRIGIGHLFNVLGMVISALVETKRLKMAQSAHHQNISVLWLMPQLMLVGIGEAFHFPGQVALYYQEFPASLKGISTAMISLLIGIAFYLSTAIIHFVRKVSGWLPDDINEGKLDNFYWSLAVIGVVNFGYFSFCAWLYRYRRIDEQVSEDDTK